MAHTPSLEECYELMEEMRRIYSSDEDAARMQELQAARKQISAACAQRESHMHELIKGARACASAAPRAQRLQCDEGLRRACVAQRCLAALLTRRQRRRRLSPRTRMLSA